MGFWSRLLGVDSYDAAQRVLADPYEPYISTGGIPVMDPGSPLEYWTRADVEKFWRSQPNLRKVVGFVARSVASTPLNAYERVSDSERRRLRDHPLAQIIGRPRPGIGPFRFWEAVLSDGLLYDRWAVLKRYGDDGRLTLSRIPSWRLRLVTDPLGEVESAKMWVGDATDPGDRGVWEDLDLDALIFDHGYAPRTAGLSPVETLKDILDETAEAVAYRRDVWENGARVPGYVHRPENAPEWKPEHREKFVAQMRAVYGRDGSNRGGMPLLEDGMELRAADVYTPKDALDLEGRQLTAVEVASAYHVSPELVGAREGNFSNIDAFRQMMYGPSLGPYITAWEQAINVGLVDDLAQGRDLYVEANIESKLRGSFLEQAAIMQSATGGPWMLRNEARALQNRPPVPGGDELIVPLNVLIGGQASPRDSGSQNRNATSPDRVKSAPTDDEVGVTEALLRAFFERQRSVVLSALGSKAASDWWDAERWNRELSADLLAVFLTLSDEAARRAIEAAGGDTGDFDLDALVRYLQAKADGVAEDVNETTRAQIEETLASDEPDPAHVFDLAEDVRAAAAAVTLTTAVAGFATVEAAKQTAGPRATKTWRTTGGNSRSSHARMNGETVAVDEKFSNGMRWPGDSSDPDETANCKCTLTYSYPTARGGRP